MSRKRDTSHHSPRQLELFMSPMAVAPPRSDQIELMNQWTDLDLFTKLAENSLSLLGELRKHLKGRSIKDSRQLKQKIIENALLDLQPEIRLAAVELAANFNVLNVKLFSLLDDQSWEVRRAAAISLANSGEKLARRTLIIEMLAHPNERGLEALSAFADEEVIVVLGRIAIKFPLWFETIREILLGLDHQ